MTTWWLNVTPQSPCLFMFKFCVLFTTPYGHWDLYLLYFAKDRDICVASDSLQNKEFILLFLMTGKSFPSIITAPWLFKVLFKYHILALNFTLSTQFDELFLLDFSRTFNFTPLLFSYDLPLLSCPCLV